MRIGLTALVTAATMAVAGIASTPAAADPGWHHGYDRHHGGGGYGRGWDRHRGWEHRRWERQRDWRSHNRPYHRGYYGRHY